LNLNWRSPSIRLGFYERLSHPGPDRPADGLTTKFAFRHAFRERRCLILADGFSQWQRPDRREQPFYIHLGVGGPFAFAGLWHDGPSDTMRNGMTWP
jgi:putative SOS response-associated peptidase YedK